MPTVESQFAEFRASGSATALAAVFDALAPELLLVAAHVAPRGVEPEDVVQNTFLDAIGKAASWDATRPLLPWLIGILVRNAQALGRAGDRRPDPARLGVRPAPATPLETSVAEELAAQVRTALDGLPRRYRQVLALHLVHGLTPAEIAHSLGCPPATVRTRLHRGLERLRGLLPAGIAGCVGALLSGRGLAAARRVVLEHARATAAPAAAAVGTLVTGLLMTKFLVGIGAVFALVAAWVLWPRSAVDVALARPRAGDEPASLRHDAAAAPKPAETRVEVRNPRVDTDAAIAVPGEVIVSLRWADDGAPVVGHEVIVTDEWLGSWPRRLAGAHTGRDGNATLSLAPGAYLVMALVHSAQRVRVATGARAEVTLRLPRAGVVVGRVVDESDGPIADAEVLAARGDLAGRSSLLATSGADGTFRTTLTSSMSFLFARKPGHGASAAVQVRTLANAETRVDLVLAAATTSVRGRVVDEANQPIEGATVRLGAPRPPPRGEVYVEPVAGPQTRSRADGSFAFDDVPPGEGVCMATAPGRRPGHGEFVTQLGAVADVRIVLGPGARVTGQVLDAAGRPAAGVLVSRGRYPDARDPSTDVEGRFAFDVVPGPCEVVARSRTLGVAVREVEVAERETRELELRLEPEPVLSGRVIDEQGAPLEGLWVLAWPKDERAWQPCPSDVTDEDGRFRLVSCVPGELDVRVRQERLDMGPVLAHADAVVAGGAPLTLVVRDVARPSAFLRLRVDDPAQAARPCALMVQNLDSGAEEWFVVAQRQPARIGPFPPGSYRVQQFHSFDRARPLLGLDLGPIALAAGEDRDLGTHVLRPTTSLRLTLARSDGARLHRSPPLRLVPADGSTPITAHITDSGEVYPFSFLPGRYRVEVGAAMEHEAASAEVELRAGATTPLALELPALRPCVVRMRLPEGRHPPYRATATLRRGDEPARDLEAWNGFVRIGLHSGTYTLTVDVEGCRGTTRFTVDSVGGSELRVDLPVR